ncbi:BTB/POZ protein [Rhizophagus clarus]|uniref:BTB/POZ protein n=1 Tax=Rhizophagus clarus TaxID=94130 RepID=A0A8H3LPS4_9GLOM|nr:BTB/POZ protein [Rhizophagus clarus]
MKEAQKNVSEVKKGYDLEIICSDKKKLYSSRAILAASSEVFNGLLYNGMKESYEKQICLPTVNSSVMKIILEYAYTGSIKESLTKDNIIEVYSAADYFQLLDLRDFVIKTVKNVLKSKYKYNYSPELLSRAVETMILSEDNILLNLLIEAVSTTPLNTIKFGRLSINALQYLLSCTHKKKKPFATPEYDVFRYSAILVSKGISNNTSKSLTKFLPTLKQLKQFKNSIKTDSKLIPNRQRIAKELEALVKFIDFRRIGEQIITDVIEPLEITPTVAVYRSNKTLDTTRGIPMKYYISS